jgi:hypothetical protein
MGKGYPWAEIKNRYETGQYSMDELADEYGFHPEYGRTKARKNGWEKGRLAEKIDAEAARKLIGEQSDKEAKLRAEYEKIITNIRRGAYNALFKEKNHSRLRQFKTAAGIMEKCRKEQWEINGIKETAKDVNQLVQIVDDIDE